MYMDIDTIRRHKIKFPETVIEEGELISVIVENETNSLCFSGAFHPNMAKHVKSKLAMVLADLENYNEHAKKKAV